MNKVLVLGGGFGLYGYVPALMEEGYSVFLPRKYQRIFEQRSDLKKYIDSVEWIVNEEKAVHIVNGIVVARMPIQQEEILGSIQEMDNIRFLFLEKPLARNVKNAKNILSHLDNAHIKYRISYLFFYCNWFEKMKQTKEKADFTISWNFMAAHYMTGVQTWKRQMEQGGGVINFYGIHIIAIMAEMGYMSIDHSVCFTLEGEEVIWQCMFSNSNKQKCTVNINTIEGETNFNIWSSGECLYCDKGPFPEKNSISDNRIDILKKHINSIKQDNSSFITWYNDTIQLWNNVRKKTKIRDVKFKARE